MITSVQVSRSSSDDRESESHLTRAPTSDDADVEGEASLESRTDRQKLKVEAEHLTSGRSVRAVVICDGLEESLGDRTASAFGKAEWEIATNDGGVLPHGAATVEDLVGCSVEVRDATNGTVLLYGAFESVPASSDDDDGDGRTTTAAPSGSAVARSSRRPSASPARPTARSSAAPTAGPATSSRSRSRTRRPASWSRCGSRTRSAAR